MQGFKSKRSWLPLAIAATALAVASLAAGAGADEALAPAPKSTNFERLTTHLEPTGENPTPPSAAGVVYLTGDGKVIGDKPLSYGENMFPYPRRADGTCDTPRTLGTFGVEGADSKGQGSVDITVDDSCNVVARLERK